MDDFKTREKLSEKLKPLRDGYYKLGHSFYTVVCDDNYISKTKIISDTEISFSHILNKEIQIPKEFSVDDFICDSNGKFKEMITRSFKMIDVVETKTFFYNCFAYEHITIKVEEIFKFNNEERFWKQAMIALINEKRNLYLLNDQVLQQALLKNHIISKENWNPVSKEPSIKLKEYVDYFIKENCKKYDRLNKSKEAA